MSKQYHAIKGVGTGRGRLQLGLRTRLYQSADHLLLLQSTGYTEDYKRVSYDNIRYVVVRGTRGMDIQAIVSGALFLVVSLLYLTAMPWQGVLLLSSPLAIWFVMNIIMGPTCAIYVNTDIQTLELPVPRRVRKVPVFIDFLRSKTAAEPSVEVTGT